MTRNIRQLSNGLRVLKIDDPLEVDSLGQNEIEFDALQLGSSFGDFGPLAKFAGRVKKLWYCENESSAGVELLQGIESITAHTGRRDLDYRLLKNLKDFRCDDVSATPVKFFNHPRLEVLDISEGKLPTLESLADATHLRYARFNACKLKSLDGAPALGGLLELRVTSTKSLANIDALKGCPKLRLLQIDEGKKISDVSVLRELHELRALYISAPLAPLADMDWIGEAPELRCAYVDVALESMDWSVIASHRHLYALSFRIVPGGFDETDEEIKKRLEAGGRKVSQITRYTKMMEIELQPAAGTSDPKPLSFYLQDFGRLLAD